MWCNIDIYEQGNIVASKKSEEIDFDFIEKEYEGRVNKYIKEGYKVVSRCSDGHILLCNEKITKAIALSHSITEYSDFKDACGSYIILGKVYVSSTNGDRYTLNNCGISNELYLRNESRHTPHVCKSENGRLYMSSCVADEYRLTQDRFDFLKLTKKD